MTEEIGQRKESEYMSCDECQMGEENRWNILCDLMYLLGCGVNQREPRQDMISRYAVNEDEMRLLYQLSRAHFVDTLTGTVLKQAGVVLPSVWEQSIAKSIRKEILFDAERAKIFAFMEQNGIWYLPLKGIILKDYYPAIGMRQMSDHDILFDETYADRIRDHMVSLDYRVESFGQGNHDVYEKEPVYNFEMHRRLYGASHDNNWERYYRDIKSRLLLNDGSSYGYHMRAEDFYIYIICHGYKHYQGSGTGVRTLLDYYVYLSRMQQNMDFVYIEEECAKLGLADFEKRNRQLCRKAFGSDTYEAVTTDMTGSNSEKNLRTLLSVEEWEMLQYYLTSGVYGTFDRMVENGMKKHTNRDGSVSKVRYVCRRIFPGKEIYPYYPFFNKHKFLLPVLWIYRLMCVVFQKERRERIRREIVTVKRVK